MMTSVDVKYAVMDASDWFSDKWICSLDRKQVERKQHSYYVERIFNSLEMATTFCERRRKRDINHELKELKTKISKESDVYIYCEDENPKTTCTCTEEHKKRLSDIALDGDSVDFTPESLTDKKTAVKYVLENYAMCPHCFYSVSFGMLDTSTTYIPRDIAVTLAVLHRKPEWFSKHDRIYLINHYPQLCDTGPLAIVKVPSDRNRPNTPDESDEENNSDEWVQFHKVTMETKDVIKFYTRPKVG